jgi:Uma2 family endonuclease
MTTTSGPLAAQEDQLELHNGDRMTREEFHRAYKNTPDGFKAELIGGIVYVASPLSRGHGKPHLALGAILFAYEAATPGVECGDNTTILLADDAEPQPDLYARVLPEFGGQTRTSEDDYVVGAPELIIEIALSSRSVDLHSKRTDYQRNGVKEYLVHCVKEKQLRWFDLRDNRELQPEADNIYRMRTFPGLWVNADALLNKDSPRLLTTIQRGIATPQHVEFVKQLALRAAT